MKKIFAALAAAMSIAGCTIEKQGMPALTGPSEFTLSITMAATPDQLPRDGRSQSVVTVTARDGQGRPVSGQRLTASVNAGTLSQSDLVTGSDGRATFAVVAPTPDVAVSNNQLLIAVTPVGNEFNGFQTRTLPVLLTGPSNTAAPVPSFTVSPAAPERMGRTVLDASASTDEGTTCGDRCTYSWDFGGESTATGRIVTYQFREARVYPVSLTVTDPSGTSARLTQNVTVSNPAAPTASFVFSPTAPTAQAPVTFDASGSSAAANHTIARYDWNFGDGTTGNSTGPTISKTYANVGSYNVTLTVTDDVGQQRSTTSPVTIGAGLVPVVTASPTNPVVGMTVYLSPASSTTSSGATIVEYVWDFGNGSTATTTTGTTVTTSFSSARTYNIRLTVRDSLGRTATTVFPLVVSST